MNKDLAFKEFNKAVKNLFSDLCNYFPNVTELKVMSTSHRLLKKINKKFPEKYCRESLFNKYSYVIKSRNADALYNVNDDENPDVCALFKQLWPLLDEGSANCVWDHLNVLLALSDRCVNT